MTAIILYSLGILICIVAIILLIKFGDSFGCGFLMIPFIIGIILFVNLKNKWKAYYRFNETSIENCSDVLNIEKFPTNKNRGILMLTIDTCLHDKVDACIKLNNGDSIEIESRDGILAIVLPTGKGVFDYIKFNYGPGIVNNAHFSSYSYSQVEFKREFTVKEGKLTYLGHITRELNPNRFHSGYDKDFNLFHRIDNTYLYRISPETDRAEVAQILKPWREAGRLYDFNEMIYDKFLQLFKQ